MAQGRAVDQAIPYAPISYGMITALPVTNPTDVRWQNGIEWLPEEAYAGSQARALTCEGDTANSPLAADSAPVVQTADPILLVASNKCSTIGFEAHDYEGRARRALAANQMWALGYEFQRGNRRDEQSLGNAALKNAYKITDNGGPSSIVNALATLEWEMQNGWYGGLKSVIFCDTMLFNMLIAAHLLERAGQVWKTAIGNVVVTDAGFTTDTMGADGNGRWLYATPPVEIYMSEVVVPATFEEAARNGRATNTVEVYAERLALIKVQSTWNDAVGGQAANDADQFIKIEVDTPS